MVLVNPSNLLYSFRQIRLAFQARQICLKSYNKFDGLDSYHELFLYYSIWYTIMISLFFSKAQYSTVVAVN